MKRGAIAGGVAGLLLIGCQSTSPPQPHEAVSDVDWIEMHGNSFVPTAIAVNPGTTVTWAFTDGPNRHNVVGEDFQSEVLAEGTFEHTFTVAGIHRYSCSLHSGMDGLVVVSES